MGPASSAVQPSLGPLPSGDPNLLAPQTSEPLTGPLPAYMSVASVAVQHSEFPGSIGAAGVTTWNSTIPLESNLPRDGSGSNLDSTDPGDKSAFSLDNTVSDDASLPDPAASPALAPETLSHAGPAASGDAIGFASPTSRPVAARGRSPRRNPRKRSASDAGSGPGEEVSSIVRSSGVANETAAAALTMASIRTATAAMGQIPVGLYGSVPSLSLTWDDGPQSGEWLHPPC